jgi:glycine cleavage system H protein
LHISEKRRRTIIMLSSIALRCLRQAQRNPLSVQQLSLRSASALSFNKTSSAVQQTRTETFGTFLQQQQQPWLSNKSNGGMRTFASVVDGLKYAESHEWTKVEGDTATIGITDFAQSELGDVVYVELPEVGSTVTKGETFGVVESVKAASDVYAPIDGEVMEVNDALVDDPSMLNSTPFEGGWMMKIKVADAGQLDSLMDSAAYTKQCED